jgi:nitrate/nitrite-specific signal transduction histidine kinase
MYRLLISPIAMGFLPIVILHLVIFGYLSSRKDKSLPARLFNGWLTCLMLLMVSRFVCHIVYAPLGGYVNWIGGIVFAWGGLMLAFQFAYRFPRMVYAREARRVLIVCSVIAVSLMVLVGMELIHGPRWSVYDFERFSYTIGLGDRWFASFYIFDVLYLLGQVWLLGVWARKAVYFSASGARGQAARDRWWWLRQLVLALWRPQGRHTRAARSFFLLALARLLSVLAFILEPVGVLPPGSFAIVYLPTVLLLVLIYINHSAEPSTLMIKLVGISLVTSLVVLGLVNAIVLDGYRDVYEQARQAELAHIETLVSADLEPAQVPAEALYVAARAADGGLFAPAYRMLFSRGRDLIAQTLEQQDAWLKSGLEQGSFVYRVAVLIENPWLSPRQVYFRPSSELDRLAIPEGAPAYRGAHAKPGQQYIRYTFVSKDEVSQGEHTLYETGYSYLSYRRMLHRKARPLVYLTVAATMLILLVFPYFFQVSLVQPLRDLLDGVARVKAGDLYVDVPVGLEDEIGFLSSAFNDMVRSLQTLHDDLRREVAERQRVETEVRASNVRLGQRVVDQTRELSVLYQVSAVASQALSLDRLLNESLTRVVMALRAEGGLIYLLDEGETASETPLLRLAAQRGIPLDVAAQIDSRPADQGLAAWVVEHRRQLLIFNTASDPRTRESMGRVAPLTLLMVPLLASGQVLGVLGLARKSEQSFNQKDITLLVSVADQIGVAVESDRLRRLARQSTLLEERQRLARDLHDSVTQFLYGLVTLSEAGQAQLEVGAWDAIEHTLVHIGKAARQALKEMRLFIHQLRPPVLEEEGLAVALHQRLAAVEGRSDVQARLLADETISLPLPLEAALYQIAQEALNNALKHADATSVTVHLGREHLGREHLGREGERVVMEIRDDGRGFELQAAGDGGGMGLVNMRERARKAGCELLVSSLPGVGTRIKVTVESKE